MKHTEFKPDAFITLSNLGGIEIMLNRSNDGVFYRFNSGEDMSKEYIYESEIEYTNEGEAGFFHYNTASNPPIFYSLNEAIRIK